MKSRIVLAIFLGWLCIGVSSSAQACPFCAAVSQTFSEEIATMDVVVIASLVENPPIEGKSNEVVKARFKVEKVIKGSSHTSEGKTLATVYYGEGKKGGRFLVMGVDPPNTMWSTPLPLSARAEKYIHDLGSLPKEGAARLVFFQDYLEDEDDMLARDAYDEFAKASYDAVKELKPDMKRGQLLEWIGSPDIPASRRRLYLTMLGVCGTPAELPLLEDMLRSEDRKQKAGLDALIACYLTLRGPAGMPLVEDLLLKNKDAEYADTYAAIMALRFHGTEADIIPRERIVEGLRHMLKRPQLADLVIPDLARWEDWSAMPELVALFKNSDEKSSWVRVPVINYLRACPLPEAQEHLKELEKIDPAAVKRANTFFPFGKTPAAEQSSKRRELKKPAGEETPSELASPAASESPFGPEMAAAGPLQTIPYFSRNVPNHWTLLGVTWGVGGVMLGLIWSILGSAGGPRRRRRKKRTQAVRQNRTPARV